MIRVVTAVVLAVAMVAAAQPSIEGARAERTASVLATDAERIERAAAALVDWNDPTPPGVPGARRTVSVRLPAGGPAAAGVEYFAVGPPDPDGGAGDGGSPGGGDFTGGEGVCGAENSCGGEGPSGDATVIYKLDGEAPERVHTPGLELRTPGGPIVLESPGRHRLVLSLVGGVDGDPAVTVRRFAARGTAPRRSTR